MRSWLLRLIFTWLGLALLQPAWALTLIDTAVVKTPQMRAELLLHAPQGLQAGAPVWLGLHLQHAPGWHSYWKNPGDAGQATELHWTLPNGISAGDIAWPTPEKIRLGDLANYGYEGEVLLPVPVTMGPNFRETERQVQLHATWLVCRQECIPEEGRFVLQLPPTGTQTQHAQQFEQAWQRVPRQLTASANSYTQPEEHELRVVLHDLPPTWQGKTLEIFPANEELIVPGAPWHQQWQGSTWQARLPLAPERQNAPTDITWVLIPHPTPTNKQGVEIRLPVQGTWPAHAPATVIPAALQAALDAQANTRTPALATANQDGSGVGFWLALGGAVLGGLILNLMPCVFPILAIKVLAFSRHAENQKAHRQTGLAYTAGVLLSFLVLGALLLGLRATGEQLGWGFQLQNPAVVASLVVLFTLIGLNLAGLFELGHVLPSSIAGMQLRHPQADAFLTGVLAVAVASPCTAPFMGASLGLALGLPNWQALMVFGAIGLGMALPYLATSFWPQVARALPKPGAWMDTLRQGMAFPMWGTVVWLLWVLGQQTGTDGVSTLLLVLLLLSFAIWSQQRTVGTRRWLLPSALMALLLLLWNMGHTIWTPPTGTQNATAPNDTKQLPTADGEWHPWTPQQMATLQAAAIPVFVDYTAAWCVTCQYNKATVLSKTEVRQRFAAEGVVLLRADWTRRDATVTQALTAIGRNGVPTYALYRPKQTPKVLSEVLSVQEISAALQP